MTKQGIVEYLHDKMGYPKTELEEIVDETFAIVKKVVLAEGKVKLSGFGNFEVRYRKSRRGRNPQTGERMMIAGRRSLVFKPSPALKKSVNK
jgi:integration host factor subunit alpha